MNIGLHAILTAGLVIVLSLVGFANAPDVGRVTIVLVAVILSHYAVRLLLRGPPPATASGAVAGGMLAFAGILAGVI